MVETAAGPRTAGRRLVRMSAFSLVELLTVIFIISLLIGILIPSINGARNAAKKAATAKALKSIEVGLEMFKNDNGRDFRQTNGYPPSFAHPPIQGYNFDPLLGKFPFYDPVSSSNPPTVYGAHWLPAMLMGVDSLGYVQRRTVPRENNLRQRPWLWYSDDPFEDNSGRRLERMPLYLDPGNVRTRPTEKLSGRPPNSSSRSFPDWDNMKRLPVIVDAFDHPVLYYVANAHGRATNMVEDIHLPDSGDYSRGQPQQEGIPFYFHQDNEGFTGTETESGYNFGGQPPEHAIAKSGALLSAADLVDPGQPQNFDTFARYIMDRKIYTALAQDPSPSVNAPIRPVNPDRYLLITTGPDGRYGTNDDVTNLPPWPD